MRALDNVVTYATGGIGNISKRSTTKRSVSGSEQK